MIPAYIAASAEVSDDGRYRYNLTRRWAEGGKQALFVMLNPSTADGTTDDPTIRRCIGFAKREGCASLEVVNLFALRATDPKTLTGARDPVGPLNDHWIVGAMDRASIVVAAWGASLPRTTAFHRDGAVKLLLAERVVHALGLTAFGFPRHPLYVPADAPLIVFQHQAKGCAS